MIRKSGKKEEKDELAQYTFDEEKQLNIPQTGLVSDEAGPLNGKKTHIFDPHLDPELQWTNKTEKTSYTIPNKKW